MRLSFPLFPRLPLIIIIMAFVSFHVAPEAYAENETIKTLRLQAEQGDAKAQFNLGVRYSQGKGVPQDYKEAVKWFRKAAEQGLAEAQFNLGVMFDNGRGVPQDFVRAYAWYNLAAAQGDEDSTKNRNLILKKMAPQQIANGQELSAQLQKKIDRRKLRK